MIRVVIADDQALVRGGFRAILLAQPDLDVVGEAGDGAEAVARVAESHPDVALVDLRMPEVDGLEATRRIVASGSRCRVLIVTTFDADRHVYDAFTAGAAGFLLKTVSPESLVAGIRAVHDGEALVSGEITRRLISRFVAAPDPSTDTRLATLTERETEVLRHLALGLANAEIAAVLHLGIGTVKTHIARILTKLAARDRVQAVVAAYESGLVRPGERGKPT
ncbi:response regulator [uncultured Amnibacterium sp.]|uniref:response regulator n=1 Tax=uncultured Amnibacterium sp. TaxID=1631851 RepID=UPI0035CAE25A